jgi:hypothetical protein
MNSNALSVFCLKHKQIVSSSEWVQHAGHHSELFLIPPSVKNYDMVRSLLQKDKKNTFQMKEKLLRNPKHFAISSYYMSQEESKEIAELCMILFKGISPHFARFLECKFEKISQDLNAGFLITITEFFEKKLLDNLDLFKLPDLLMIFSNICEAILALHKQNYFHSNLCIENICLDFRNKPKIVGITNCQKIGKPSYEVIYEYTKKKFGLLNFCKVLK